MIYRCHLPLYQSVIMAFLRVISGLLTILTLGMFLFPLETGWSKLCSRKNSGSYWIDILHLRHNIVDVPNGIEGFILYISVIGFALTIITWVHNLLVWQGVLLD